MDVKRGGCKEKVRMWVLILIGKLGVGSWELEAEVGIPLVLIGSCWHLIGVPLTKGTYASVCAFQCV